MTIATVLAAGLLPVIPQPTQWMPAKGTCDIATANVSVAVCADAGLGEEGYTMKIAPGGVEIVAGGETGRLWAWQTIAQLKAGKDVMMDIWYNPYYQPAEALDAFVSEKMAVK